METYTSVDRPRTFFCSKKIKFAEPGWSGFHQSPGTQAVAVRLEALSSTRRFSPEHFTLIVQQTSKDLVKLEQN